MSNEFKVSEKVTVLTSGVSRAGKVIGITHYMGKITHYQVRVVGLPDVWVPASDVSSA